MLFYVFNYFNFVLMFFNASGGLRSDLHFANRLLVDSPAGLDTANRPRR